MLTASILIVVILVGIALMPAKKTPRPATATDNSPQVVYRDRDATDPAYRQVSQRQLRIDEDAAAIAGLYQQRAHDAYMDELAATGSKLIAGEKESTDA